MNQIKVDISNAAGSVAPGVLTSLETEAREALATVDNANGAGNDFLGWNHLPSTTPAALIDDINATAEALSKECEGVVCIGIGGSDIG
ncbi:MAG: glucose-6-phosphate isomerase, partial [Paramuribaculum sp.]|nr:glucose-6-phosphate isomerase [Paramuribaculum sp.]